LGSIRKISKSLLVNKSHYDSGKIVTLDRAIEDYFGDVTAPGSIVTVEGFLTRFIMSPRSGFDSETITKVTGVNKTPIPLSNQVKVEMSINTYPANYPIQAAPPIELDGKKVFIYFLYAPDFDTFHLAPRGGGENIGKEDLICRSQQPVIVISPELLVQDVNKAVRITGELAEADVEVAVSLFGDLSLAHQSILRNSIRPFVEGRSTLCLDLRRYHKISSDNIKKPIPAVLYVESHFENLLKIPNYQKFIGESFPGSTLGLHWFGNNHSPLSWGLNSTETAVCTSDFESYAFFMDTQINNFELYEKKIRLLHGFVEVFRKTIQNGARANYGVEIKHQIDFMFDYSKARLFHPDGVMVSKKIEEALRQDPSLKTNIDWIKGK
jgi:hypothetical protein